MVVVSGIDPLRDEAMKSHEDNEKAYEEAIKENKEAIDLISGDETKKKEGKIKSSELKKMHLSEELFTNLFESFDGDIYVDVDGIMGPRGDEYSMSELIDLYDDGRDYDPVMSEYDDFDSWWADTSQYMKLKESFGKDDLRSDIYNALADVCYAYRNENITKADIEAAIEWFEIHFFEDEEDADFFLESQHLTEDVGDDFLDKINKKIVNNVTESLTEDFSDFDIYSVVDEIVNKCPVNVDVYNYDNNESSEDEYYKVQFSIRGDWKHDHLAFEYWMNQNAEEISGCEVKYNGEEAKENDEDIDDFYEAIHTYIFIPKSNEEPEEELEPLEEEPGVEEVEENEFDEDSIVEESLKFNIAKEQLKRFNEGKMIQDWSPQAYLENLVKKNHLTEEQKNTLEEAFLK